MSLKICCLNIVVVVVIVIVVVVVVEQSRLERVKLSSIDKFRHIDIKVQR